MHLPPYSWVDDDWDQPESPTDGIEVRPPAKRSARKASPKSHATPQPEVSAPRGIWGFASRLLGGTRRGQSAPALIARRRSG